MATVLLSSYAKLPHNITSSKLYDTLVLVVTVDTKTGKILESDCTLSTELAKRFVSKLIVGHDLGGDIEDIIAEFECCFFGSTKKAIESALKTIHEKYLEIKRCNKCNKKGGIK